MPMPRVGDARFAEVAKGMPKETGDHLVRWQATKSYSMASRNGSQTLRLGFSASDSTPNPVVTSWGRFCRRSPSPHTRRTYADDGRLQIGTHRYVFTAFTLSQILPSRLQITLGARAHLS